MPIAGDVKVLFVKVCVPVNVTFPAADGTSGQILQTDGSGTLSFTTA